MVHFWSMLMEHVVIIRIHASSRRYVPLDAVQRPQGHRLQRLSAMHAAVNACLSRSLRMSAMLPQFPRLTWQKHAHLHSTCMQRVHLRR